MNVFKGIWGWMKGLFSDPAKTAKGVEELAATGLTAYGMAKGVVPVNASTVGAASNMLANSVGDLASSDETGQKVTEAAAKVAAAAAAVTPVALGVKDQIEAAKGK